MLCDAYAQLAATWVSKRKGDCRPNGYVIQVMTMHESTELDWRVACDSARNELKGKVLYGIF